MPAVRDPYDLQRFASAQDPVYPQVLRELLAARKTTHWMWFIFPQIEGLGHSAMARRYALGGLGEARAYLAHPALGPRLAECTRAVLDAPRARSAHEIFGSPDDMKFHSSMSLFAAAAAVDHSDFHAALARFFQGVPDRATMDRLGGA